MLGFILTLCYDVKLTETFRDINIYSGSFPGGISLGLYILMGESSRKYNRNQIKEHEWGHTRQSLYLGPLYLIFVGLSSIIWAWYWTPDRPMTYYDFWTENWADRLGGVRR